MSPPTTHTSRKRRFWFLFVALSLVLGWREREEVEAPRQVGAPYLGEAPPGRSPRIFAPGVISGVNRLHGTPVFPPDGSEVYWSAVDPKIGKVAVLFMKTEGSRWSAPTVAPFSRDHQNDIPFLAPGGETLYFVSDRPLLGEHEADKQNVWWVRRTSDGWSKARTLGAAVNSMPLHWQISVTGSGALYFATDGMGDIYRATLRGGKASRPVRLGDAVNTDATECCPFVSSDGALLLFARSTSAHGADLFVGFRTSAGAWSTGVNLGREVNTDAHDLCPIVSPDGEYLFFLSERDGRPGVFWVRMDVVHELRRAP